MARKRPRGLLATPVVDMELSDLGDAGRLVAAMGAAGGFTGRKVADGASILHALFRSDGTRILSFPAALMATGTRGLLRGLVQRRLVDAVITTCGTADHDLARTWGKYYRGEFEMDDAVLKRHDVHRLGNILVPAEVYGAALEKRLQPMFREMHRAQKRWSTRELLWEIERRVDDKSSLLYWCWRNRIPIYVPAMFDGAVGSQLWLFWQDHKDLVLEEFRDEQELAGLTVTAKAGDALMIGGGGGEGRGGRTGGGIGWGRVSRKATHVTTGADATLILPMLLAASVPRRPT